jgi:hypothetical protein
MVAAKRKIDKKLYVYSALFPKPLIETYNRFIHLCFKTYVEANHDAQLRTAIVAGNEDRRKSSVVQWVAGWDALFVTDQSDVSDRQAIRRAYFDLMDEFSASLGIGIGPRSSTAAVSS